MYKVGIYEKEITPLVGCSIRGYYNLRQVSDVKDKTYVKSVAISSDEKTVIFIAVDGACFNNETYDNIRQRASKLIGISIDDVMVAPTHSHTGGPSFVGQFEGADDDLDEIYLKWLECAAADVAYLAYKRLEEATISLTTCEVKGISYVRNYLLKSGIVRTNPGRLNPDIVEPFGEPDYTVPVLLFKNKKGEVGMMYSFGCHQDCVDGTEISGDYSSIVAKRMKEKLGSDFVSIYFSGTAGNVNHFNVKTEKDAPDHYVMMGNTVADCIISALPKASKIDGEIKVLTEKKIYETRVPTLEEVEKSWVEMNKVEIPYGVKLDASAPVELFNALTARSAYRFATSAKKYSEIYLQVFKIGNVKIFAFAGEVFTQYGKRIKEQFSEDTCFFITLANQATFYVPPRECYLPHLYESKHASAKLNPDDSEDLIANYIKLAKSL